jgi:phosphoribosyl 1,2-cyclic phosphate phosphodiesterase
MRFTFLGTGTSQGVPVIGCTCDVCLSGDIRDNRLRTSALVEVNGNTFVIDTGPDFRQQMLRNTPTDMPKVLFTHEHKDHIAGLDDIRAFNFKYRKPIDIYATAQVQEALKREFHYVFSTHKYPGVPEVNLIDISDGKEFTVSDTKILPIRLMHYKMPVFGFRIENLAYITDANYIAPEEREKLKNLDVLVLNALRKKEHISHFNLEEALEVIAELKPKRAYLTHISHLLGRHEVVSRELPENVFLSEDGLTLEL